MENKVAIVILNWNTKELLAKFLPVLIKNTNVPGTVIYVVDNHSFDGSASLVKKEFPGVKLIELSKNHGFAGGYNMALQQIDAEYYVLLNSDVEVEKNWLTPLVKFLDKNNEYGVVMPKIMDYSRKHKFEYAGAAGGYIDKFGYPFCRGRLFTHLEEDRGQYDQKVAIHWASGACLMVRSRLYHELGGLDVHFFAHMEEIDFCWRLANRNHKLACIPASRVYHVGGGTLPKSNPRKTYLNFRNSLLLVYKNLPDRMLNRVLVARFFLDILAAFFFLMKLSMADFRAVLNAIVDFYKVKKKYIPVRKSLGDFNNRSTNETLYKGSVVWQYYFKRKRKFSQIIDSSWQKEIVG
jgi:hypothetical protein